VLVHLVDVSGASGRDPIEDFETIRRELSLFNDKLASKPQIVAATKMDAVTDASTVDALATYVTSRDLPFHRISAVTGQGLDALLEAAWKYLALASSEETLVDAHRDA
jgi:GTP-binding protein